MAYRNKETICEPFYVYKTKKGTYYKNHNQGSWSVSLNGVSPKAIQTSKLSEATRFTQPFEGSPYDHPVMRNGVWKRIDCVVKLEEI
ncbi:hypothetical protein NVP1084O_152 [Vibrio phage 1.084.O._10N.261.49.F5]|nr:hypothetical protein NVP1084O_152 [Vibrio phage 1.084.O._10N.261.49.F5]